MVQTEIEKEIRWSSRCLFQKCLQNWHNAKQERRSKPTKYLRFFSRAFFFPRFLFSHFLISSSNFFFQKNSEMDLMQVKANFEKTKSETKAKIQDFQLKERNRFLVFLYGMFVFLFWHIFVDMFDMSIIYFYILLKNKKRLYDVAIEFLQKFVWIVSEVTTANWKFGQRSWEVGQRFD